MSQSIKVEGTYVVIDEQKNMFYDLMLYTCTLFAGRLAIRVEMMVF